MTFTVGTGNSAQHCSATTNSAGQASCSICSYNQSASPLPVTVSYGGNTDYSSSSTSKSVTVVTPTSLSVSATTATYNQPVTLNGTLTNSVTGQGISGQTVTLTLNGSQSCTATTGSYGKASCTVTPTEPSGTYTLTGSFAGNTATNPQLLSSNGSNKVVVNGAPTTLTYTGAASVNNGQSLTLSATLTNNGTPLANQPVVLTLGTGRTAQSCNATTNASGVASCTVSVNQLQGSVTVTVSYAGSSYYQSSSASSTVNIGCQGGGGSSAAAVGTRVAAVAAVAATASLPPPVGAGAAADAEPARSPLSRPVRRTGRGPARDPVLLRASGLGDHEHDAGHQAGAGRRGRPIPSPTRHGPTGAPSGSGPIGGRTGRQRALCSRRSAGHSTPSPSSATPAKRATPPSTQPSRNA